MIHAYTTLVGLQKMKHKEGFRAWPKASKERPADAIHHISFPIDCFWAADNDEYVVCIVDIRNPIAQAKEGADAS